MGEIGLDRRCAKGERERFVDGCRRSLTCRESDADGANYHHGALPKSADDHGERIATIRDQLTGARLVRCVGPKALVSVQHGREGGLAV